MHAGRRADFFCGVCQLETRFARIILGMVYGTISYEYYVLFYLHSSTTAVPCLLYTTWAPAGYQVYCCTAVCTVPSGTVSFLRTSVFFGLFFFGLFFFHTGLSFLFWSVSVLGACQQNRRSLVDAMTPMLDWTTRKWRTSRDLSETLRSTSALRGRPCSRGLWER